MDEKRKQAALAKAAHTLNRAGVVWALGASALLYFAGITDTYHDFDLLVAQADIQLARQAFAEAGAKALPAALPSAAYATGCFCQYTLGGMGFDLLCDFAIRHGGEVFRYPFDSACVTGYAQAQGERIPLSPLLDWWVLYLLMPGREDKVLLLERYLRQNPSDETRDRLGHWLRGRLPSDIRERVLKLHQALNEGGR